MSAVPVSRVLAIAGTAYLAAVLILIVSKTPLGSTLFFAVAAVTAGAYGVMLARVWNEPAASKRLLYLAFALAVLFRAPAALAPVGADSDMVRYLWDGRVQLLGYNPYTVVPSDPALDHTHAGGSESMPSRRHRTPYPPAAQLFFRLVVSVSDSTLAMKLALVACDLLTMVVLWRWLAVTGRNEWLTLAYAWHPLVILEVAHSGHIDALGALWVTAAAYWLARRWTALATVAFVLAVATKLLPVVLAPIFLGRVRARDLLLGAALLAVLYLPFAAGQALPTGSVPNVVANIRFNGPVFRAVAAVSTPQLGAAFAVVLGLCAAAWARWHRPETDPAAWAWPMALSLAAAPVVYPWYLLCLTPFLWVRSTLPLTAWSFAVVPVYLVWRIAREGGRWLVPSGVMFLEYGVLLAACGVMWLWSVERSARHRPDAS